MSGIGRAVAMLTLYLEHEDDSEENPELEELVDTIPLSELTETIWELLSCARAMASSPVQAVEALRALGLSAAQWEAGR